MDDLKINHFAHNTICERNVTIITICCTCYYKYEYKYDYLHTGIYKPKSFANIQFKKNLR